MLIVKVTNVSIAIGLGCMSAKIEPSPVIQALGFGDERAYTAIRVSVGCFNTLEDLSIAINLICDAAKMLHKINQATSVN